VSTRKQAEPESAPANIRAVRKEEDAAEAAGRRPRPARRAGVHQPQPARGDQAGGDRPRRVSTATSTTSTPSAWALVEQSFRRLHDAMRGARARGQEGLSTATFARGPAAPEPRPGEPPPLSASSYASASAGRRRSARRSPGRLRAFENDLALDLARDPSLREWSPEDIRLLSALLSTIMTRAVEETIESTSAAEHAAIESRVLRQLQMLGGRHPAVGDVRPGRGERPARRPGLALPLRRRAGYAGALRARPAPRWPPTAREPGRRSRPTEDGVPSRTTSRG